MEADFISRRIKELSKQQGISNYRLSQLTGMSQTALSKITNGKCLPTIPSLEKICEVFHISISQFFSEGALTAGLTEQQEEIISIYTALTEEEQRIFLNFIRSIRGNRRQ